MTLYIAEINSTQHAVVRAKSEERVVEILKSKGFDISVKRVETLDKYNTIKEELVMII